MPPEPLRLLFIEHDTAFARYVGEMLGQTRDLAAEVHVAENLHAGLAALQRYTFEAVLLDLYVPDGAGLANIALVNMLAPQVPVVAIGESGDEIMALEAMHAGAQDYLVISQLTPAWLERSVRYAIERHRLDRALFEAEESYHSVFDHLVEGIFRTTREGRYLMANAALARIYGYTNPEQLIQGLTDIGRRLYVEKGRREEFVRLMQEHDVIVDFESPIYRKDGSVIWISENCRAVRDSRGRLLYYEGTVEDITQRRNAEEKLRTSEALYHSLVETLPQNILRKDCEGRFTFANKQFCKLLGRTLEEIVGKTDFDFFPRELAEKYQRDDRRVVQTGRTHETVEEHIPQSGGRISVQVVKTPLYGADGRIIGLQAIFWDITEQRVAEEKIRRANILLAQSQQELSSKNAQMEEDLKMAREIQLTTLPQQYPVFPPARPAAESAFQFTHRYLPAGTVGGDFFAVSALSDNEAAVFICDVAGHGVRSALVTAMIRALVEELKPFSTNPGQFLSKLNTDLHAILKHTGMPMLTTAFYLVADWSTGVLRFANAGHPKPLHIRRDAGKVQPVANVTGKSAAVLGLFEKVAYETSELTLAPRDMVMLFTDGLYEVEGPQGELYSQDLLVAGVQRRVQLPAARLFDELLAEVQQFAADTKFADDVCLVAMEYAGPAKAPSQTVGPSPKPKATR
jgi:phosphoserine phosphatase RsbU/P